MANSITLALCVTMMVFGASLGAQCSLDQRYPFGESRGDNVITDTSTRVTRVLSGTRYKFSGDTFDTIQLWTDGYVSFEDGDSIVGVRWADTLYAITNLTLSGTLYWRLVDLDAEVDVVRQLRRHVAASGHTMGSPRFIIIATWERVAMHQGNASNTNSMQLVFSADDIDQTFHLIIFGSVSYKGWLTFSDGSAAEIHFSLSNTDDMLRITDYRSYGLHPGMILTRVDPQSIILPDLERVECGSCKYNMTTGAVVTFDGDFGYMMNAPSRKYFVANSLLTPGVGEIDSCKFMIKYDTDKTGGFFWVGFMFGRHSSRSSKYKKTIGFYRNGKVGEKGQGIQGETPITKFPYYIFLNDVIKNDSENLLVNINMDNLGKKIQLRSPSCPYRFTIDFDSQEFEIELSQYYQSDTIGVCQNFNSDVTDELGGCMENVLQLPNRASVLEDCSCDLGNKACLKVDI